MSDSVEIPPSGDLPTESASMGAAEETHTTHPLASQGDDISPDKDGGVLKAIKVKGDETEVDKPMPGDTVYVHYVGTLLDGKQFDSSRDRGEKFSFKLGQGSVIKAWDIGVATMRRGEISVLTCKPEYAYGERGQGSIPPDSTLVFEVELFDWKGEDVSPDKDGSILKRTLHVAEKSDNDDGEDDGGTPNEDALVEIHLSCLYEGKNVDDRAVKFNIGEGHDHGILEAVETGIKTMEKGERAQLKLQPQAAFGSKGNKELNIPPNAPITFNVLLKDFTQAKDTWEMDIEEKIAAAEACKEKGAGYYKSAKIQAAVKKWKRIIFLLETETGLKEDEKAKSNSLQLAANLNLALAYLKLNDFAEAVKVCSTALEFDANSEKGFFRRGQAHFGKNDFELAKTDFEKVSELSPENKAAKNQITLCNQKIKQQTDKEKRLYKNMFDTILRENREKEDQIEQKKREMAENVKNFQIEKEEGGQDSDPAEPTEAAQAETVAAEREGTKSEEAEPGEEAVGSSV